MPEHNTDIFLSSTPASMATSLLTNRLVVDGEPVNASVTNRMPQTNRDNLAYLHGILRRLEYGSGEFLWGVPAAEAVEVGDFVYYDAASRCFTPAIARYVIQNLKQVESESTSVWGVVIQRTGKTVDICTSGLCEFKTNIIHYLQSPEPGPRYLSSRSPGKAETLPDAPLKCLGYLVGVKVDGSVQFFMKQSLCSDTKGHEHKTVELKNAPAGSIDKATPRVITSADAGIAGWLPANHSVFAGKAPAGAKYGYSPVGLQGCQWPLRFATNAGIRWQRCCAVTDDPLAANVPAEFYRIDDATIWWMIDDPLYLPWDANYSYVNGEATSAITTKYPQRVWLDYVNSGYGLSDSIVSSLRAVPNCGISVSQHTFGGPAITGDLDLDFNFQFKNIDSSNLSGLAVKGLDRFNVTAGPVVSGFRLDSSRIKVVHSDYEQDRVHYGVVTLGDPTGRIGQEIPFEAIHLQGVEEAVEREAIGLAFPSSRSSHFLARILVPYSTDFDKFKLSLIFGILTPRSGTVTATALKLSYRIIASPVANNVITAAFPQNTLAPLSCNFGVQNSEFSQGYYTAESDQIEVRTGDILLLKVERNVPDGFADRLVMLRKSAVLHFFAG